MLSPFSLAFTSIILALSKCEELKDKIDEATRLESGSKWCPVPLAGTQCPASGFAWHYKCCGDLNNECCFHLQNWAIVALVIVGILCLASFVLGIVRCLFCRRN
uniref:Uncharacterized protein n=1 Tax=Panagrolaimus sp. ES5 TaxID=591445 RepID=A0AC34F4N9_9BILA